MKATSTPAVPTAVPAPSYPLPPFRVRKARSVYAGDIPFLGAPTFDYPSPAAIAEDMLDWLEHQDDSRAVLDPDTRTWLRYDPASGIYRQVPGTAEQAARVFIREAARACEAHQISGWRPVRNLLTAQEPLTGLGGIPLGGHQATIDEIARAMVDLSCGTERANAVRRQLEAGRDPSYIFAPCTWDADIQRWGDNYTGEGIPLDFGVPDPYEEDYKVPTRATGYAPAYISYLREATADEIEQRRAERERWTREVVPVIRAWEASSGRDVADTVSSAGAWLTAEKEDVPFSFADAQRYTSRDVPEEPPMAWDSRIPDTPMFDHLCSLVWPDPAVRDAALRSLSMGFTGRATKFVVYWRSETNRGKSLMAALMKDLLGSYAKQVPAKSLFGHSADPQRAAEELAGTWLAIVEEGIGAQSFKADEAFKSVTTGGGDLNARRLYQESRQVAATHTILLAVNPEADMNFADPAVMARLCPVRFDGDPAAIAAYAEHYNPSTAAWKAEAPAVLATMLDYARDFWSGRWRPYTLADIAEQAVLAEVIDDGLTLAIEMRTGDNVGAFVDANRRQLAAETDGHRARDLYQRYARWCAVASQEPVSETAFGRALPKCDGVTRARERTGTVYRVAPPADTK